MNCPAPVCPHCSTSHERAVEAGERNMRLIARVAVAEQDREDLEMALLEIHNMADARIPHSRDAMRFRLTQIAAKARVALEVPK